MVFFRQRSIYTPSVSSLLSHDISLARLEMYTRIPSVSSATDSVLYLWYGNSNAVKLPVTDVFGRNTVWNSYQAVWHMDGSGDVTDVSGHNNLAVNTASPSGTGLYGGASARTFDGSGSQYFTVTGLLGSPASLSIFSIVNCTNVPSGLSADVIDIGGYVNMFIYETAFDGCGINYQKAGPGFVLGTATPTLEGAGWGVLSAAIQPAASHEICYVNSVSGGEFGQSSAILYSGLGTNTIIGNDAFGGTSIYQGSIEEVRVINSYKASTWHLTSYNNFFNPQTFSQASISAIVYDNSNSNSTGTSPQTLSLTIGSGSNRTVFIGVSWETGSGQTLDSLTFNGKSVTDFVDSASANVGSTFNLMYVYRLIEANLPVAGTYNIVATLSSSPNNISLSAISLANVDQGSVEVHNNSSITAATITTNITTSNFNSWLVEFCTDNNGDAFTANSSQTIRQNPGISGKAGHVLGTKSVTSPGINSESWTQSTAARLAMVLIGVAPFSSGLIDVPNYESVNGLTRSLVKRWNSVTRAGNVESINSIS
jgi:hypothetical protein